MINKMIYILAPQRLICGIKNCNDCEHLNTRGTFCELFGEDVKKDSNDGDSERCESCLKAEKAYNENNK